MCLVGRSGVFSLRRGTVKQRITTLFASGVLALALFGVAMAGPLEDAQAADQKGDYATELQILRPLAEQGNALAQLGLGVMYANGQGVPQDYGQAVVWYRKAADQGDADAHVRQRPRRAAGLRAGPHLVSQGRRARGTPARSSASA
jgi:TPR repeat protein